MRRKDSMEAGLEGLLSGLRVVSLDGSSLDHRERLLDRVSEGHEVAAVLEALDREARDLQQHRRARRLARGLLNQLGLYPESLDLVGWLDGEMQSTNLSMLTDWVLSQLEDEALDLEDGGGSEALGLELLRRFQHHLALRDGANDPTWG